MNNSSSPSKRSASGSLRQDLDHRSHNNSSPGSSATPAGPPSSASRSSSDRHSSQSSPLSLKFRPALQKLAVEYVENLPDFRLSDLIASFDNYYGFNSVFRGDSSLGNAFNGSDNTLLTSWKFNKTTPILQITSQYEPKEATILWLYEL